MMLSPSKKHNDATVIAALFLGTIILLSGCSGCPDARITALHDPMHPSNTQAVTFKGEATGSISRIELDYEQYELSNGPGGTRVETLIQPFTTVKTCTPSGSTTSLTCTHTMPSAFSANTLIKFRARVFDNEGRASSETYSFAAGSYPWPNDPIPIRVKGDASSKFDVVFIPDTDITVNNFRAGLNEVIEDLYFKYDLIKDWRGSYNFYYSGVRGNYEESCNFTNPSNMANLTAIGDAVAFLHSTNLRDCRSGDRISSEIDYDKTLIHETGHVLFGLKDEYCCDSSYSQQPCNANIWSSLAACEADASDIGLPESNCTQICDGSGSCINFWRIDPTGTNGCMMGPSQHNNGSEFGLADVRRIKWVYGKCAGGECSPSPACP